MKKYLIAVFLGMLLAGHLANAAEVQDGSKGVLSWIREAFGSLLNRISSDKMSEVDQISRDPDLTLDEKKELLKQQL